MDGRELDEVGLAIFNLGAGGHGTDRERQERDGPGPCTPEGHQSRTHGNPPFA